MSNSAWAPEDRKTSAPSGPTEPTPIEKTTAEGCDFHEPYFGANYPDACCINGYLWDLDSCDKPGGPLHVGGDVPCPKCNHEVWLTRCVLEEMGERGWDDYCRGKPRCYQHTKIRHEQPGDSEKCEKAWLDGFDLANREKDLDEQRAHHE